MSVIAAKDLRQRMRDRSAFLMGIVAPLALVFILDATLASTDDPEPFAFAVFNGDDGEVAADFGNVLDQLEAQNVAKVAPVSSRSELEDLVDQGQAGAGFVIEAGFSEAVAAGRTARITVVGNREAPIATDVAASIARSYTAELDRVALSTAALQAVGQPAPPPRAIIAAGDPIAVTDGEAAGEGYDISTYFSVSLSVFFLFFTVQFGLLSLLEEREVGTLRRLLVSPIDARAVIGGKLVASFVLGVVAMVVLIVSTTLVVGADWGALVPVATLTVAGVLTAMALISLVASVARTSEQASNYGSIVSVVLGLLGGAFFPINQAPRYLEILSWFSPHRWLLDGFRDASTGADVIDLAGRLAGIGGFIVIAGGVGLVAARRTIEI